MEAESIRITHAVPSTHAIAGSLAARRCGTWHGRTLGQKGKLIVHSASSSRRAEIEEFIRREFFAHFGAHIRGFMPQLVALHDTRGDVRAVVGCRGAAAERLFLESYTCVPIEQAIAERLNVQVPREQIVEVGSLACAGGRAAMQIVAELVPALIAAGYTWVVLTGSDAVRNLFRRLRLAPQVLCSADKSLLGAEQHDWGTYYLHHPLVMAGRLVDGVHALKAPSVQ